MTICRAWLAALLCAVAKPASAATPAATPMFGPPGGTYNGPQSVTILDTTPGAKIYYTTNGSTPSTNSTLYGGPIAVGTTTTVKAIAAAKGYANSAVASATYTIQSLPDLYVSYIWAPTSAMMGDTVQLRATAQAGGVATGNISTVIAFYLSADTSITTSDVLLGTVPVALAPGGAAQVTLNYLVPSSVSAGVYYIGAIIDPTNAIAEWIETNNATASGAFEVQPDTRPPVITVSGISDGGVATTSPVTVCYTVSESNPSTDLGELDLLPFRGCADASTPGVHSVIVNASDAYGNDSRVTLHFTIDLAAPAVSVTSPVSGAIVAASSVDITAVAQDDAGIASVTANGVGLSALAGNTYRGTVALNDGENVIQVTAMDLAGRSAQATITIYRDSAPPGTYYCYDGAGNLTARVRCPFGTDCSGRCP